MKTVLEVCFSLIMFLMHFYQLSISQEREREGGEAGEETGEACKQQGHDPKRSCG